MRKFKTKITEMLGIEYPILMGGMQWITKGEFVAAVCNAGATGFITAESFDNDEALRAEIRKTRTLTDKPFGVNISMLPEVGALADRTLQFLDVVCEEGIPFVETAGRKPTLLMEKLKEANIKVIHKLTSVRHAISAQQVGVDAVTMIGYGSGGHVGMDNVANFILIPTAIRHLDIPVVAGGGIADGRGLLAALAMGAEAVLMGTAFFATEESPVHRNIKEKIVEAHETDTSLIMSTIKNPARCVNNRLVDEVLQAESHGATLDEIISLVIGGKGKFSYETGDPEIAPIACGQVAGLVSEIKPVARLIEDIVCQAGELLDRLNGIAS